ncbi:MAG: lipoyl(octanoyl) transferase LipB [Chloroflexi bacterium]|nr:lipoyl(octanoyl) transferase LipB [Chloroflexota bacterium]
MEKPSAICTVHRLGMVTYEKAWKLQEALAVEVASRERSATLLLLEHPHTYTFGRRGQADHLLWDEAELTRRGVTVQWVDRGGDVTYHGPGQLVGYPLIPLATPGWQGERLPQMDYVGYLRKLETALVAAIARLGLATGTIPGLTGVWVQPDVASRCPRCDPALRQAPSKIASIGVKVDVRGVTRHGFALNVAPDMSYWQGIVACGLDGVQMVSLADLFETPPEMEQVQDCVVAGFGEVFGFDMVEEGFIIP